MIKTILYPWAAGLHLMSPAEAERAARGVEGWRVEVDIDTVIRYAHLRNHHQKVADQERDMSERLTDLMREVQDSGLPLEWFGPGQAVTVSGVALQAQFDAAT